MPEGGGLGRGSRTTNGRRNRELKEDPGEQNLGMDANKERHYVKQLFNRHQSSTRNMLRVKSSE